MSYIPATLREHVLQRAASRCEYCGLAQAGQEATFHIDHVIPLKSGGKTTPENLALACVSCSLRKAARQSAIDPQSNEKVALYNPRRDNWREHFTWNGAYIVGMTANGRATLEALKMNRPIIIAIRKEEAATGHHPPNE